jgi:hypothetical protein
MKMEQSVPESWQLNFSTFSPMKMEQTECSETLATKLQYPLCYEDGTDRAFRKLATKLQYPQAYEDGTTECSGTLAPKLQYPQAYEDVTERVFRKDGN